MENNQLLASLRLKKNITQQEFASIIGVSYTTYKEYEAGLTPANLEILNKISNYYNVSLDYLLGLTTNPKTNNFRKDIDYSYLRFSIAYLRKKAHLNQKELAKEFDISAYSISKFEHNSQIITATYLKKIAQKFQYSSDYLCGKSLRKEVL